MFFLPCLSLSSDLMKKQHGHLIVVTFLLFDTIFDLCETSEQTVPKLQ